MVENCIWTFVGESKFVHQVKWLGKCKMQ